MPRAPCPCTSRIAAALADPAAHLNAELAQHLPQCEACRQAVSAAVRDWPTDRSPSPSLAEWLSGPTGQTTLISPFQADAIGRGQASALDLGPYLLLDRLGAGGMGQVYRAWHRLLRREDAVKTVRPELASNPSAMRRFLREAATAAKVRHPNVVQVYTADQAGTGHYIAMEFVPGTDLARLVRADRPLEVSTACDYLRQAAEGIHHAYMNGLVHRDIKPANLLVTTDGQTVKVTDFGVARAFEPDAAASEVTSSGTVLGTTDYMAPEQAEDAHSADTRADVYSLGCTLFYLLTGRVPFPGGSLRDKLNRHATVSPPSVTSLRPDVPPEVDAIVRKCMAKRPEQRYQTPGELAEALRAVTAAPPTVVQVAPFALSEDAGAAPTASLVPSEPRPKSSRSPVTDRKPSRRWLWVGAMALSVAVVATIVIVVAQLAGGSNRDGAKGSTEPGGESNPGGAKTEPPKPNPPPNPNRPAQVILPNAKGTGPWVFTTACWSERTDKVRAVGFMADDSIHAGREGGLNDGTDSGYWEMWPKTGGKATRSVRAPGTDSHEFPLFVHLGWSLHTDRFRRLQPTTLESRAGLSTDMSKVDRGTAQSLDSLCATGDNKFLLGGVTPDGGNERKKRLLVLWEASSGNVRTGWRVETEHDLKSVASDNTGDTVATGTFEGKVVTRTTAGGRGREWTAPKSTRGTPDPVSAVAISSDGKTVYSAHTVDGRILVWDVAKDDPVKTWPVGWQAAQLALSPDKRWLVAIGPAVTVWDLKATSPLAHVLAEHWAGDLKSVAFHSDSKRLVVGGWARRDEPTDGAGVVWVWDLK